jgi:hypothetical protein
MFPVRHSDLCRGHFSTSAIPVPATLNSSEIPVFIVLTAIYVGTSSGFHHSGNARKGIMRSSWLVGPLSEAHNHIMCLVNKTTVMIDMAKLND